MLEFTVPWAYWMKVLNSLITMKSVLSPIMMMEVTHEIVTTWVKVMTWLQVMEMKEAAHIQNLIPYIV